MVNLTETRKMLYPVKYWSSMNIVSETNTWQRTEKFTKWLDKVKVQGNNVTWMVKTTRAIFHLWNLKSGRKSFSFSYMLKVYQTKIASCRKNGLSDQKCKPGLIRQFEGKNNASKNYVTWQKNIKTSREIWHMARKGQISMLCD